MAIIHAENLYKYFDGFCAVNDVSISINPGEVVAFLGVNGAGKTTSFYAVVGVVQPDAGDVTLNGTRLNGLPIHTRARLGLGYLPQETSVFRRLSVEDNLKLVLEFQPLSLWLPGFMK